MLWAILDIFKKLTVLCKPSCTVYETLCIKKKLEGDWAPTTLACLGVRKI